MKVSQMMHFPLMGAGTGIYVDLLTKELIKRGHEVNVLCSDHKKPDKPYPVDAVLFNNGSSDFHHVDFDFPVFASHPLTSKRIDYFKSYMD